MARQWFIACGGFEGHKLLQDPECSSQFHSALHCGTICAVYYWVYLCATCLNVLLMHHILYGHHYFLHSKRRVCVREDDICSSGMERISFSQSAVRAPPVRRALCFGACAIHRHSHTHTHTHTEDELTGRTV